MRQINWNKQDEDARRNVLARPEIDAENVQDTVREVLKQVRTKGDAALREYTARFDKVALDTFEVSKHELRSAAERLDPQTRSDIARAIANIEAFHVAQTPQEIQVETEPGLVCRRLPRPIRTVGIYVPGGSAPLFSSVLMMAVPARIAGVDRIVVTSPPRTDGNIHPMTLAACWLTGVTEVYAVGGAQAIGALAYGTSSIPRVDKIFGPGNTWVATAKHLVAAETGGPAIDLPAGPSEVMVVADEAARPDFVASDLLSQAEHDPMAQVVLITTAQNKLDDVQAEVQRQVQSLPRSAIALQSLANSIAILANDEDIADIINSYAPEHLILQIDDPERMLPAIRCAGSIFLGAYTPEALGDYASGTNHVLPTAGAARAYSGLGLESFYTYISVQSCTRNAMHSIGPTVERLAQHEELDAHARAITLRLGANA